MSLKKRHERDNKGRARKQGTEAGMKESDNSTCKMKGL